MECPDVVSEQPSYSRCHDCHNLFLELSPSCSPQLSLAGLLPFSQKPTRCTQIGSNHIRLDPLEPIPIACRLMANASVITTLPSLRDVMAFQDHVVLM